MRRRLGVIVSLLAIGLSPAVPAMAEPATYPTEISLPDGFPPEGIAIGAWPAAYVGNRVDGRIHRLDLRTGGGRALSPATGTPSLGIKVDSAHHRLFVAGGTGGDARVVDARTGAVLASYTFATGDTFVNDLVITPKAVWFTDSRQAVLYRLPLGRHGRLPAPDHVTRLQLTGDLVIEPGVVNLNGIVTTPDRRALIAGQSNTGKLFRIDPRTGTTREIDLAGESLPSNDGQLREGRRLYVVQNRLNYLAKLRLNPSGTRARVVERRTDPRFDVPATVATWGRAFYLVNARFTTEPTPATPYSAVAVDKF